MSQQQNNPQSGSNRPNPFSSRYNRSSSGSSGSSSSSGGQQQQQPARPSSRFGGGLGSRFGSTNIEWQITPVYHTMVRFDLTGLGDPFHRLLGEDLNLDYADRDAAIKAIEAGSGMVDALVSKLEEAWENFEFSGAAMLYPWQDDIRQVIANRPAPESNTDDGSDDDDDDGNSKDNNNDPTKAQATITCLRAIDLLLVLNVLARTRSFILLAEASMTLEQGFLGRSLITDDPRLVALARATGCLEEHFTQ